MIKIVQNNGAVTAVVACDVCREIITDYDAAIAAYPMPEGSEAVYCFHVHQEKCYAKLRTGRLPWQPLRQHLKSLFVA